MTTRKEIESWFLEGASEKENTHMIIVCDTFDYEDYPVYVTEKENVHEVKAQYDGKNMQKIMEVYNLRKNMAEQLALHRCFSY